MDDITQSTERHAISCCHDSTTPRSQILRMRCGHSNSGCHQSIPAISIANHDTSLAIMGHNGVDRGSTFSGRMIRICEDRILAHKSTIGNR